MKSAYELAMERLEGEEPSGVTLTEGQKGRLEELNREYRAKIAEREVFLRGKAEAARAKGDSAEVEALEREVREEKRRLEEELEEKKEAVRRGEGG